MITHRVAVDSLADMTSTTYCGEVFHIMDDDTFSQDPTCKECRRELIKDRRKVRKSDPEWLQFAVAAKLKRGE